MKEVSSWLQACRHWQGNIIINSSGEKYFTVGFLVCLRLKTVSINCAKIIQFSNHLSWTPAYCRPAPLTLHLDEPECLALCLQPLCSFGFLREQILCQTFCMFKVGQKRGDLRKWRKHLAGGCCH